VRQSLLHLNRRVGPGARGIPPSLTANRPMDEHGNSTKTQREAAKFPLPRRGSFPPGWISSCCFALNGVRRDHIRFRNLDGKPQPSSIRSNVRSPSPGRAPRAIAMLSRPFASAPSLRPSSPKY